MKKDNGSVRDLSIFNYHILKRKTKLTGESVCLCTMEKDSNAILVALLNNEGKIQNSQVFIFTEKTKKQVMKSARKAFCNMLEQLHNNT